MMRSEPFDEPRLLEAARNGDEHAMGLLIERYQPRVLRFGLRMCRNVEDAQDVVQDTLLAAARGLKRFEGRASISTWLYTIARSYCIKKRRRSKFAPPREESLNDDDNDDVRRLAAPERSPEQAAMDREMEAALRVAIDGLEPMYREVLVLRDMEGLTAPEVAQVVGASVGAVKSRLHRARARIREALLPFLQADVEDASNSDCPDVIELFSKNLEGEISESLCHQLQSHVDRCPRCKRKCDSIQRVVLMCRTQREPIVPEQLRTAVSEAVRALQSNKPTGSFR